MMSIHVQTIVSPCQWPVICARSMLRLPVQWYWVRHYAKLSTFRACPEQFKNNDRARAFVSAPEQGHIFLMSYVSDTHKERATAWFADLRDQICNAFESLEDALTGPLSDRPAGQFERKAWDRPGGCDWRRKSSEKAFTG